MRILIASDKFKGTLTAQAVGAAIASALPEDQVDQLPIADGGEGTSALLGTALEGTRHWAEVRNALGVPIQAEFWLAHQGQRVIGLLEMSAASGLAQIPADQRNPDIANTYGTGQLMLAAIEHGATQLIVGIGGSATNDGGTGAALALGYQFVDEAGTDIQTLPQDLQTATAIKPPVRPMLPLPIQVACDVDNPLLGSSGATRVYGPQKGIERDSDQVRHEAGLNHLTHLVQAAGLNADAQEPGAGAAGGLGYGLVAFADATLVSGFDLIAQTLALEQRIAAADLVITGEGRLDAQSLMGKGPVGVARMATKLGKPVVALCGRLGSRLGGSSDRAVELALLAEEFTQIEALVTDPDAAVPTAAASEVALVGLVKRLRPFW